MNTPNDFSKLMPGFDFLQDLVKNAGAALPGIGQWVAPTLDPAELEKRIQELRTVQFWLEQNARMMGTTIQALEVQRMTLSTLKTMNVQMGDLRDALKIRVPEPAAPAAPASAPAAADPPAEALGGSDPSASVHPAPGAVVDPLQWWGALTKQFTELASQAIQTNGDEAARRMASAMAAPSTADQTEPAPAAHKAHMAPAPASAPARKKAATRTAASKRAAARD